MLYADGTPQIVNAGTREYCHKSLKAECIKLESVKNLTRKRKKKLFVVVVADTLLSSIFQLLKTDSRSAFVAIQLTDNSEMMHQADHGYSVFIHCQN